MKRREARKTKLRYIDLFSGCGGLSTGLIATGWKALFAVEKSPHAFLTLSHNLINKKNHFKWVPWLPVRHFSVNTLLNKYRANLLTLRGKVDLVAGGPPCQGFSAVGKRRETDKRNKLVHSYIRFIRLVQPNLLFFENVRGFTTKFKKHRSKGLAYSTYVVGRLKKLGYDVHGEIVDFSLYGLPQRRKRFILVGTKLGSAKFFFELLAKFRDKYLRERGLKRSVSVGQAISDLLKENGVIQAADCPRFYLGKYSSAKSAYQRYLRGVSGPRLDTPDSHRFANHSPAIEKKFNYFLKHAPRNQEIGDVIKAKFQSKKRILVPLDQKSKSPTLTTLPDDCIHYKEPRILTVREYARIQSFPDWFEFQGPYTTGNMSRRTDVPRYTQIGNAIPPIFGEQSGLVLKEMMKWNK